MGNREALVDIAVKTQMGNVGVDRETGWSIVETHEGSRFKYTCACRHSFYIAAAGEKRFSARYSTRRQVSTACLLDELSMWHKKNTIKLFVS